VELHKKETEKQGTKEGRAKADRSMDPRGESGRWGDPIMDDGRYDNGERTKIRYTLGGLWVNIDWVILNVSRLI
jgi:hypothetical protein